MKISADIIEKDVRRDEGSTGELLIKLKPKHRNYVLPFPDTSSTNWNSIKHQVMNRCGLSPESQVSICYIDEENDKVRIDSDAEFHEAIRVGHKCGKKLKIVVKESGSDEQNIVQHSSGETFSYRELESGEFVVMDKLPSIQSECEPVNDQSVKQKASLLDKETDSVNDTEESSVQLKDDLVKEISEKVFERVMRTLGSINLNSVPEAEQKPVFAQKTERSNSMLHVGVICDHCRTPIHGIGYKCGKCPDYDLCEQCERIPYVHNEDHFFLKIRHNTGIYNQVHGLCASMENTAPKYSPSRRTSHAVKATVIRNSVGLKNRKEEKIKKVMRKIEKYRYPSRDAEFIKDETIPYRTITPGLKFQKSWRVRNTGSKPFTSDTVLKHSWGGEKLKSESTEFPVPPLLPGQEGTVSVSFTAPPEVGSYLSHWRLSHKGVGFGGRAWCVIEVEKLQEQSSKESTDEINEKCTVEQNNVQEGIAQVLTAVQEEQQRGDGMARKVAILSHTATPTNTPFDLSPPKSPEPQLTETPNCIKETKLSNVKEDNTTLSLEMQSAQAENYTTGSESDDTISVINLNSSESDTEFVIVPMPLCCNMDIPLVPSSLQQGSESDDTISVINLNSSESDIEVVIVPMPLCCNMDIPLVPSSLQQDEQRTNTVDVSETCSAPSTRRASVEQLVSPSSLPSICVCGSKESNASESSYSSSSPASERAETPENTLCSANVEGQNLIQLDQILPTIDNQKEEIPISPSVEAQNAAVQGDSGSTVREAEPLCQNDNGTAEASNIRNENTDNEERMVQVLPEGLVNGALTAAASVYNTARAVITGMQNRNEPLHEDWRQSQTYPPPLPPSPMQQLFEMGFCNRALNHHLLVKHKGRVEDVVTELVANHDNDWYAHRHNTNPYLVNFD